MTEFVQVPYHKVLFDETLEENKAKILNVPTAHELMNQSKLSNPLKLLYTEMMVHYVIEAEGNDEVWEAVRDAIALSVTKAQEQEWY